MTVHASAAMAMDYTAAPRDSQPRASQGVARKSAVQSDKVPVCGWRSWLLACLPSSLPAACHPPCIWHGRTMNHGRDLVLGYIPCSSKTACRRAFSSSPASSLFTLKSVSILVFSISRHPGTWGGTVQAQISVKRSNMLMHKSGTLPTCAHPLLPWACKCPTVTRRAAVC